MTLPAAPDSRLELVRTFVNTLDEEDDALDAPAALREWLAGRGLLAAGARVTGPDLAHAVEVREALRALLLANNGEAAPDGAAAPLDAAAARAGLALRFTAAPGGAAAALEPTRGGTDGALGRIVAAAAALMAEGTWPRLKACSEPTCRWAYYDTSRNGSRKWCSMRVCGNRAKARAYRARRTG